MHDDDVANAAFSVCVIDQDPVVCAELTRIIHSVSEVSRVQHVASLGEFSGDSSKLCPNFCVVSAYNDGDIVRQVAELAKRPQTSWLCLHFTGTSIQSVGACPNVVLLEMPIKRSRLVREIRKWLEAFSARRVKIGEYYFDPVLEALVNDLGEAERLTHKEALILKLLWVNQEKGLSRSELMQKVWGYSVEIATHTLATHIYRLRQKIEENASYPKILLSLGDGYQLDLSSA